MTDEQKERESVYVRLLADWFEKMEFARHFQCSEREARRIISDLARLSQ